MAGPVVATDNVLAEIGWNNSYRIPVANAENKRLQDEILNQKRQVTQLSDRLSHDEDRVTALKEHLKNVRSELNNTHALHAAQVKSRDTEVHLKKVCEREVGRIKQELMKLDRDEEDLKEKKNHYENSIFNQTQRLEEKKSQMNWDNSALEAWLAECKRRDEDAMVIAKYSRQDEEKIRELNLKIANLTDEWQKKKRQLDHETLETQTAQVELDKTAEEFRKAHSERQELLRRWEQTIDQMSKRDQEMNLLALELEKTKAEVRNKENICKEKEQFYRDEIANNKHLDNDIARAEREVGHLKMEFQEAERQRNEFESEVETLKRTVDRTAIDLEAARSEVTQLKQDNIKKADRLEVIKKTVVELQEKIRLTQDAKLSADERSAKLTELLQQEEANILTMNAELKQLRVQHFAKTQDYNEATKELKRLDIEIQGTRSTIVNLVSKIREKDKETLRQEEIIYNQDFNIQALQRRLSAMQGEQSNDEQVALEAKIRELTKHLNEKASVHNLLSSENKRQQDEVRKVKRRLENTGSNRDDLKKKIDELELHIDNAQRMLRKDVNEKQEKMVDENVLKLEVKKLRDALYQKADNVLSLEKHKLQLQTAMKERRLEIDIHSEMLVAQLRAAEDERRQTNIELQERITKIDKLKKRYESIICMMAPPEGEEERSQAFYVIKAAQEKEELQRHGDELDALIRKLEKEICALKNTLKVMRSSNETMRKDQCRVPDAGDQVQERHVLEEQVKTVIDKYRTRRGLLRELQEDLQRMSQNLDNLIRDEENLSETIDEKQAKILQLKKDFEDQQTKIDRVTKMNSKLVREIRNTKKVKEAEEERDIDLRELRELNRNAIKQVGETIQRHPEIAPSVHQYFEQADLPLPASGGPGSRGSSSSSLSSVRSSMIRSGSLSSVRSAGSSSQGSLRSKPSHRLGFTVFGDDVPIKPPSGSGSSTASLSGRRSRESKSSSTIRQFNVFGDDLVIKSSSHSASSSSRGKPATQEPVVRRQSSGPIKPFTAFGEELLVKGSAHSGIALTKPGSGDSLRQRRPSLTRDPVGGSLSQLIPSAPKQSREEELDVIGGSAASQRPASKRPRSKTEAGVESYTIFGDEVDVQTPSRRSSEQGSARSSKSGRH